MYILFFLFLIIILLLLWGSIRLISLWLCLFLSTLLTCIWILSERSLLSLKYFILQEIFTGISLFSLILLGEPIFFFIGLWFKLGLPPLHSWFLTIFFFLKEIDWFLTFSKLIPILLFYNISPLSRILFFVLFFSSFMFLFIYNNIKPILFFRRNINFIWGFLISQVRYFLSVIWILFYFLILFFLLSLPSVSFFELLTLLSLPPSIIFFVKLSLLFWIIQEGIFLYLYLSSWNVHNKLH